VTRLVKFSPSGRLFTLGNLFENCRSRSHFCAAVLLSTHILSINNYQCIKNCVGTHFGRFYQETHLVILATNPTVSCILHL
jgi:hypothetical protein